MSSIMSVSLNFQNYYHFVSDSLLHVIEVACCYIVLFL